MVNLEFTNAIRQFRLGARPGRSTLFKCLRLILFYLIFFHYLFHFVNLSLYFQDEVIPKARDGTLFIVPAASTGECYANDFLSFYAAGFFNKDRLEKNLSVNVYDPFLLTQAMERIVAPLKPQGTYFLRYSPSLLALLTPLAYFDVYTAWRIWFFALAICVTIAYLFVAGKALETRRFLLLGLLLALASFPICQNFVTGQIVLMEVAFLSLALRFLIDQKYFWAGLFAAASLLKPEYSLIVLIPGFLIGKRNFAHGFLFMVGVELILSILLVGCDNVFNFIKMIFTADITGSFSSIHSIWYQLTFAGMSQCLPWFATNADKVGEFTYALVALFGLCLWLVLFPVLEKTSKQAIELIAATTVIAFVNFGMHNYCVDYALYIIPCLWLYIWSTTNEAIYSVGQSITRLFISVTIFYTPFFFWENLFTQLSTENTFAWYQLRVFWLGIILLICSALAIFLELKTNPDEPPSKANLECI